MDRIICKKIIGNKKKLVPYIFTEKQIEILERYLSVKVLSNSEKTYLYSTIKNKIDALALFKEEYYISGENMLPERVELAKKILKDINKDKAFISGSFLYKKDYADIDIYIIGIKRKQYHQGKYNFICLTQTDLSKPLFYSLAKYSVSNFIFNTKPIIKKIDLSEVLLTYQLSINEVLNNEDKKTMRHLLFYYYLYVKKEILNSYSLYLKWKELLSYSKTETIVQINRITKELMFVLYSYSYLYLGASKFQNQIKTLKKDYNTENLPIYINFIQEVKDECRRAEA